VVKAADRGRGEDSPGALRLLRAAQEGRVIAGWWRTLAVGLAAAGFVALALASPASVPRVFAKEGPCELLSHGLLLLATLAWAWLATRVRGGARLRALVMAAFLALLLAEELDWGAVLGWPALGLRIEAVLGHRNLHNSLRGASYLLFGLPLALHFAAPGRVHGPLAPLRDERAGFFAIAGLFGLYNLGPWERSAQELLEGLLYALLLACGWRLGRASG
jgi:hypothetical protein